MRQRAERPFFLARHSTVSAGHVATNVAGTLKSVLFNLNIVTISHGTAFCVLYSAKNYDSPARNGPFLLWRKQKRKAFQATQQLRLLRRQKNATARGATFFSGQAFHGLCWSRSDECGRDAAKCDRALRGAAMKMERMARGTRGTAFLLNYKMVIVSRGATFFSG
jgi:hypothetical protein